jgi:hypothetical protein
MFITRSSLLFKVTDTFFSIAFVLMVKNLFCIFVAFKWVVMGAKKKL